MFTYSTHTQVISVGLFGGSGGSGWDDAGKHDGVREIVLKHGDYINSIQVVYEKNSKPVYAVKHGGSGGDNQSQIKLQYPEEMLISVSGTYDDKYVTSLSFKTNWRKFGPYGVVQGTHFSSEGGKIVGFKGSSGEFLDAIGFHIASIRYD